MNWCGYINGKCDDAKKYQETMAKIVFKGHVGDDGVARYNEGAFKMTRQAFRTKCNHKHEDCPTRNTKLKLEGKL